MKSKMSGVAEAVEKIRREFPSGYHFNEEVIKLAVQSAIEEARKYGYTEGYTKAVSQWLRGDQPKWQDVHFSEYSYNPDCPCDKCKPRAARASEPYPPEDSMVTPEGEPARASEPRFPGPSEGMDQLIATAHCPGCEDKYCPGVGAAHASDGTERRAKILGSDLPLSEKVDALITDDKAHASEDEYNLTTSEFERRKVHANEQGAERAALQAILDCVDYNVGNCKVNNMVGAILPETVIKLARAALSQRPKYHNCKLGECGEKLVE